MSSEAELRAALNFGPFVELDPTGVNGVSRIALDGNSQSIPIPEGLRGMWLDLFATVDVQWGFGRANAAPTIVTNQLAALGTGHASAAKDLPAGVILPKRVPLTAKWLVVKAAVAGGFFSFDVSEKPLQ
jgi:hypothetical protein